METTVTRRLLAILKQLKYKTQQEIGDLLGVSRGAAGTYERGTQSPSVDSLELVFKAHPEINTEYVLKGKGTPFITGDTPPKPGASTTTPTPPLTEGETTTSVAASEGEPEPPRPAGGMSIVRLTYEELLAENADLHRQLKATTGQVVDMLTQEVKRLRKPLTSSEAADLRETVDQIAREIPAALYVAPGFKQGIHRQLA